MNGALAPSIHAISSVDSYIVAGLCLRAQSECSKGDTSNDGPSNKNQRVVNFSV